MNSWGCIMRCARLYWLEKARGLEKARALEKADTLRIAFWLRILARQATR